MDRDDKCAVISMYARYMADGNGQSIKENSRIAPGEGGGRHELWNRVQAHPPVFGDF